MEDVARQAGVSRPTIYYYFPDKDALVLEVIVRQVREIHRRIREKIRVEDGLVAMIEASLTTITLSSENQYLQLLTQPDSAGLDRPAGGVGHRHGPPAGAVVPDAGGGPGPGRASASTATSTT